MDRNTYGHDESPTRYTGARFTFSPKDKNSDLQLIMTGYDIDFADESEVFVNDTSLGYLAKSPNNAFSEPSKFPIPKSLLVDGVNIIELVQKRPEAGLSGVENQKWAVRNILIGTEEDEVVDGEPSTSTLLDEPEASGAAFGGGVSTDFTFEFVPRGPYYGETVKVSFDSYVKFGGLNGFDVLLNGNRIKRISSYRGKATYVNQSVTLDKSQVRIGSNTLTIRITTPNGGHFSDAGFEKVRVQTSSVPLLDIAARNLRVADDLKTNKPFEATVVVNNVGAKTSTANTLSFYVSDRANKSDQITVANSTVAPLILGTSRSITLEIKSREVKNDRYFWACIGRVAEDILAANDCSAAIQLDVLGNTIAPIMMLLED